MGAKKAKPKAEIRQLLLRFQCWGWSACTPWLKARVQRYPRYQGQYLGTQGISGIYSRDLLFLNKLRQSVENNFNEVSTVSIKS